MFNTHACQTFLLFLKQLLPLLATEKSTQTVVYFING